MIQAARTDEEIIRLQLADNTNAVLLDEHIRNATTACTSHGTGSDRYKQPSMPMYLPLYAPEA